ncbi:LOW QUALITY PROTEIN: 1-acylglycerol-3-phosphate O-acyltransferase PNPLA3 [Castor canadensis]|uniref:LOW QUALITY PROTEIN: 1-acylglycerol-3-phosphate O-acyltransferase PNPLA3 n=1 Tax=Castor canadensis TaxID=51338 RepID=A0A8B7VFJ5_CASCN
MHDSECRWSLSFCGCGFLGFYHIGATRCLSERAPHLLRDAPMFYGCSAGAVHCVIFLSQVPLDQTVQSLMDLVRKARRQNISTLHPSFEISKCLRDTLEENLPSNVHQLISGKVGISLTRVSDGKNVLVSDFQSKDEVLEALMCSCSTFRGVRYVDGGLSDNIPFLNAKTTITVSPFYGEYDICPKVKSTNFLLVDIAKLSLRICMGNAHLLSRAFFSPSLKEMGELCFQGYLDGLRFLQESGMCICNRPQLGPNLSLEEMEQEVMAPYCEDSSMEGDKLLDPLSLTVLPPWDETILEILSPRLTTALHEAIEDRDGYLSKVCNLLPVRILSYMLLPCTLPVESAIAAVHRLVMWLPDLPNDIQWLHWATSQVCVCVTTCLLPSSRSQMPASIQHASSYKPEIPECSSAAL